MECAFRHVRIFFVISGFLISGIIFDGLERGEFSFVRFYSHRINPPKMPSAIALACDRRVSPFIREVSDK